MADLGEAIAAIDARNWPRARAELLKAWREQRSPTLVREMIRLLDGKHADALRVAIDRLPSTVVPDAAYWREPGLAEQIRDLASYDDPRACDWLIDTFDQFPFWEPGDSPVCEAIIAVLAAQRGQRLVQRLDHFWRMFEFRVWSEKMRARLLAQFESAIRTLPQHSIESVDACAGELAARRDVLLSPEHDEAAFLTQIEDSPDDDLPRRVYGDWLNERANPRGEFIALQLKGEQVELSQDEKDRETTLIQRYGTVWLGNLSDVFRRPLPDKMSDDVVFRRGFLAAAGNVMIQRPEQFAAREWRTVAELNGQFPIELLLKAPLNSLWRINSVLSGLVLAVLDRIGCRLALEEIAISFPFRHDYALISRVFPHLETLNILSEYFPSPTELRQLGAVAPVNRLVFRVYGEEMRVDSKAATVVFESWAEEIRAMALPFASIEQSKDLLWTPFDDHLLIEAHPDLFIAGLTLGRTLPSARTPTGATPESRGRNRP